MFADFFSFGICGIFHYTLANLGLANTFLVNSSLTRILYSQNLKEQLQKNIEFVIKFHGQDLGEIDKHFDSSKSAFLLANRSMLMSRYSKSFMEVAQNKKFRFSKNFKIKYEESSKNIPFEILIMSVIIGYSILIAYLSFQFLRLHETFKAIEQTFTEANITKNILDDIGITPGGYLFKLYTHYFKLATDLSIKQVNKVKQVLPFKMDLQSILKCKNKDLRISMVNDLKKKVLQDFVIFNCFLPIVLRYFSLVRQCPTCIFCLR